MDPEGVFPHCVRVSAQTSQTRYVQPGCKVVSKARAIYEGEMNASFSESIMGTMAQKKLTQRVLNEANHFLPQTIHSICKAIEVWDRFSRRDLAYLSDILKSDSKKSPIPSVKVVTMIEDHIDALRDLQRRAEEQRDLCAGLARKVCKGRRRGEAKRRGKAYGNSWKCRL
ncbi:hypothetical protein J7337_004957 [Fusarium musae]|uniref:Uncharacterized protein n=1 Tax=Fusarium musae TaxID=1042133 RepID=A0A9P8IQN0_9HYPO|nr:hypothetical protein J7337_004957 [Fusarium musae]KAG9502132.1 hypothetical protein J7337_004957 [Fusarium musae]